MLEDTTPTTRPQHLVVIGGGMVARRLIDALRERDETGTWAITLLCEESRAPYDRVALTSYFTGREPDDLALGGQELWEDPLVTLKRGVRAESIDREARTVTTSTGAVPASQRVRTGRGCSTCRRCMHSPRRTTRCMPRQ